MIRKLINYTLLILAFLLIGIFSFYCFKVFYLKEPIIIDNYFSKNKNKIKSILANGIDINQDQTIFEKFPTYHLFLQHEKSHFQTL